MRHIILLLSLILAAFTLWDGYSWVGAKNVAKSRMTELLSASGTEPNLASEPDRLEVRLLVARSLLQDALRPYEDSVSEEAQSASVRLRSEQLKQVQEIARAAAEQRPTNWSAQLLKGASLYLERSLLEDRSLFTAAADWEVPLQLAIDLSPRGVEAERFLAMAYLEIWPMLSEQKRELTRQLLRPAFEDEATFRAYVGPWLSVNGELDEALELLPSRPFVWREILRFHRSRKDWPRYIRATEELAEAVRVEIEQSLNESSERLQLGDLKRGRSLLVEVAGGLPVDGRWAGLFDRTLSSMPPGPIHRVPAVNVTNWLEWALEQCTFRDCPISATALTRAAVISSGEADSLVAAGLAAGDDLVGADSVARRSSDLSSNEWSRFHLLKARQLFAKGRVSEARDSLARVNELPELELGRKALIRSIGAGTSSFETSEQSGRWIEVAQHHYRQDVVLEEQAPALKVSFAGLPPRGCPVELEVDGSTVHRALVHPRRSALRHVLTVPLSRGPHRLAVRSRAGCYFTPGDLSDATR